MRIAVGDRRTIIGFDDYAIRIGQNHRVVRISGQEVDAPVHQLPFQMTAIAGFGMAAVFEYPPRRQAQQDGRDHGRKQSLHIQTRIGFGRIDLGHHEPACACHRQRIAERRHIPIVDSDQRPHLPAHRLRREKLRGRYGKAEAQRGVGSMARVVQIHNIRPVGPEYKGLGGGARSRPAAQQRKQKFGRTVLDVDHGQRLRHPGQPDREIEVDADVRRVCRTEMQVVDDMRHVPGGNHGMQPIPCGIHLAATAQQQRTIRRGAYADIPIVPGHGHFPQMIEQSFTIPVVAHAALQPALKFGGEQGRIDGQLCIFAMPVQPEFNLAHLEPGDGFQVVLGGSCRRIPGGKIDGRSSTGDNQRETNQRQQGDLPERTFFGDSADGVRRRMPVEQE